MSESMRFELDGQLRHDMTRAARKLAVGLTVKLVDQPGHVRADAMAIVSLLRAVEASGGAAGSEPGDELANIEALR